MLISYVVGCFFVFILTQKGLVVGPLVSTTSIVTTKLTIKLTSVKPKINRNATTKRTMRKVTERPRTRKGVQNALLLDLTFVRTLAVCKLIMTLTLLFTGPFIWSWGRVFLFVSISLLLLFFSGSFGVWLLRLGCLKAAARKGHQFRSRSAARFFLCLLDPVSRLFLKVVTVMLWRAECFTASPCGA